MTAGSKARLELAGLDDLVATVRPGVGRRGRPVKARPAAPALPAAAGQLAGGPAKALPAAVEASTAASAADDRGTDGSELAAEPE